MNFARNDQAVRWFAVATSLLILSSILAATTQAQTLDVPKTPRGWKQKTIKGKHPNIEFKKEGLKSPDFTAVKFYKREPLIDLTLSQWVQQRLGTKQSPLNGKWEGPILNLTRQTRNVVTAERRFEVDGILHSVTLSAVCVDKLHVRMGALIQSLTSGTEKSDLTAGRLLGELVLVEIAAAKKEERGLDVEKTPPKVKGVKGGGKMKAGRYIGTTVGKKDGKAGTRFDIVIFENGEYEILGEKRSNTGQAIYSSATGRLELQDPFNNDERDWDDVCIYGVNDQQEPVIHAEGKYRLTQLKCCLLYTSPSPRDQRGSRMPSSA